MYINWPLVHLVNNIVSYDLLLLAVTILVLAKAWEIYHRTRK